MKKYIFMDNISNLFKNLNQRLSSPFFFSFLLSWCVFNWQIIIALLFYKHPEVRLDGYHSYIDLVKRNTSFATNIAWPLVFAFIYTFLYPLFKNVIDIAHAWSKNWGDKGVFRVSKTSKIPIKKYLELREIYKKRTEELELVVEQDSIFIKQIEDQKEQIHKLKEEKNYLSTALEKWQNSNNYTVLEGSWEIKQLSNDLDDHIVETIVISSDTIHYNDRNQQKERIIFFYHSPDSEGLSFVVTNSKTPEIISLYNLQIRDDFKQLKGTVIKSSETHNVTFIKRFPNAIPKL